MNPNRFGKRDVTQPRAETPLLSAGLRETRPRVALACRRLARHIVARGLQPGDIFPAQQQLRALTGMSNDTLMPAMRLLQQAGVVRREERFRTRVADLEALSRIGWTVGVAGLAAEGPDANVFYSDLLHRLSVALTRAHCTCRSYFRLPFDMSHWPENRLADYPHLEQDVREGRVDGILVLTNLSVEDERALQRQNVPVCHVGGWACMSSAVLLDATEMVEHAYGVMRQKGCRRLLLVDTMGALEDSAPTAVLRRASAAAGGPVCETLTVTATHTIGQDIAAHLLMRPSGERPDGVIVTDDYVALGMAAAFAEAGDYRPLLAVRTNRHIPLHFALPVIRYEVDSEALAAEACAMMHRRLLNPVAAVEQRRCGARPPSAEEDGRAEERQSRPRRQALEFAIA